MNAKNTEVGHNTIQLPVAEAGKAEQRSSVRVPESALMCLHLVNGTMIEAALHDISTGGALVETDIELAPGEPLVFPFMDLTHDVKAIAQPSRDALTPLVFVDLAPQDTILLAKHIERQLERSEGER